MDFSFIVFASAVMICGTQTVVLWYSTYAQYLIDKLRAKKWQAKRGEYFSKLQTKNNW